MIVDCWNGGAIMWRRSRCGGRARSSRDPRTVVRLRSLTGFTMGGAGGIGGRSQGDRQERLLGLSPHISPLARRRTIAAPPGADAGTTGCAPSAVDKPPPVLLRPSGGPQAATARGGAKPQSQRAEGERGVRSTPALAVAVGREATAVALVCLSASEDPRTPCAPFLFLALKPQKPAESGARKNVRRNSRMRAKRAVWAFPIATG